MANFNEIEKKNGRYRTLIYHSREELFDAFEEFKNSSKTGWRCTSTKVNFGQTKADVIQAAKCKGRVQWSLSSSDGISFEFDGIPFISAGSKNFHCHQGPDVDLHTKQKRKDELDAKEEHDHTFRKRRILIQATKKLGCPAKVNMARILKFPEFQVAPEASGKHPQRKLNVAAANLKNAIKSEQKMQVSEEYVLMLPEKTCHKYHVMDGEGADLREPIDNGIVKKIQEMDHIGVRSVAEVRRHLVNHVQNELFRDESPPSLSRRRYYPSDNDIRNILSASRIGNRKADDDQTNLEIKCEEWRRSYPEDFIFYRQSMTGNQESRKFLFVYQSEWMKRLLLLYGQDMCLMDATYRTCRYALPLFFLCVRSNVCYIVIAVFIPQNEDKESLHEVLEVIKQANPTWKPRNMMVDFSLAEIGAIEDCFPGAHIHVCDFHREKAWTEWVSKGNHGVSHCKEEVLGYLRAIAKSENMDMMKKNINVLRNSGIWQQSQALQQYFAFWELHLQKWVRFFRERKLRLAIYTNNGIERQNNWLKTSYVESRRNSSISDLVGILMNQFLPDSYKKYKELNIKSSNSYKCYNQKVPEFLHNRPKHVVKHIMSRLDSGIKKESISKESDKLFNLKGGSEKYQVWLGSEEYLPSCQCRDYKIHKLPCKHICAVVGLPGVGWDSLGSSFKEHPLFTLDPEVIQTQSSPSSTAFDASQPVTIQEKELPKPENVHPYSPPSNLQQLPSRKRNEKKKARHQCVQSLKYLLDELYLLQDVNVLESTLAMIKSTLQYTRQHHTKENGISLKDKSLSPSKRKKVTSHKKKKGKLHLFNPLLRKKAKRHRKRFGEVADHHKRKVTISNADDVCDKKKKRPIEQIDVEQLPELPPRQDIWVDVGGIKLTTELHAILIHPLGWLSDEHIDAGQHLIKQMGTGVGGLNSVTAMTHYRKVTVHPTQNQTIQCHNIGGHWVTSTTIYGSVVVYDSLSSNLNDALKRQLVHIYKHMSSDDGKLNVTVVLQQHQNNGWDCGLFCIANAIALAHGVNPITVFWDQKKMRAHLEKCFESKQVSMFPNSIKYGHCKKEVHTISIYCVCLKHIPGAKMVRCAGCNNYFHYEKPNKCIKLNTKQAAAIIMDEGILCHRCDIY